MNTIDKLRNKMGIAVALVAICALSVVGTMAFLQDSTDVIENTFTVGKVKIVDEELIESETDEYGVPTGDDTTEGNEYVLIPNHTYTKDPHVTIAANSEDCYVFYAIDDEIKAIEADPSIESQMTAAGFTKITNTNTAIPGDIWAKNSIVSKSSTDTAVASFGTFKIKGTCTNSELESYASKSIDVRAYAVQSDGFDSAQAAWNATFGA